jgi:transketolase
MDIKNLQKKANDIRRQIYKISYKLGGTHIGGCLSCTDIMTVLYYNYLKIFPDNPLNPERDRFILSKGHSSFILYYILADKGFFSFDEIYKIGQNTDTLGAHPEIKQEWGIELTTGSLGLGLSVGCGIAKSAKLKKQKYKTVVLMGDGELQEGTVWESVLFAAQHKLDNLIVIIDYNKLQAIQPVDEVMNLEPLHKKWESFNWQTFRINGHNISEIYNTLKKINKTKNKPSVIIADTVKGKGISYMENKPLWHYRCPNEKEYKQGLKELRIEN